MTSKKEQQHEDQLRGGSDAGSVGKYLLHRAKPHLPPWLGIAGTGVAGALGNWRWEGSAAAGVGLTLASVALTGATWWAGRTTSAQRRLHSAITVAAGSAWVTAACLAGPTAGPLDDLFLMGGPAIALSWNVRMVMRRNPDATGESSDKGLLEKVGLARTQIGAVKVEPNKVTVPYALPAGEATTEDMSKALPRIAGALDVPKSAVRNRPDPDSARRGELVIVPRDMLREVVWYPGPSAPGGSIAEPLTIGVYDDGRPLQLTLPQAIHLLVMGVTGAGKTEGAIDVMCEVLTRRDVAVWLSDPKRGQDLGEAFPACDWVVDTADGSELMIEALKAAVPARQAWLGSHGYRSWEPAAAEQQTDPAHSCQQGIACGCAGMPYLLAWFEEAANTLRATDDDVFTGIAQEARSAGASLVISMQRASGYQISTDTRASLPASLCFGVDERDAQFALPSEVLDAGANPGAWGNKRPGYCYLCSAGVDEDLWSTPSRTFRNNPVTLEWVARAFEPVRMGIDQVTASAAASVAGQRYTSRAAVEQPQEGQDMGTEPLVDPEDVDIDPEAELPEQQQGDDAPIFGEAAGRKPSPAEARHLLARALADFEAAGQMIVGPKDFMDWCDRHGLSRPWVSARLKEAAQEGRLEPTSQTGRWRIVPALTPA
ncbi:sporulation protein SsgA [Streptomyces sp. ZS0098]|uniref:plasmid transfer protein TraB n=1 Tax=Streptomyces sp. ZS0098 TaxID=1904044 RepID=UPI000EFB6DBA|nr:plasmid transfer protein TraB [Streptomyces sp. ZS0098]RMI92035.1 sporulation protein SsgA [Streptomyces sp. ZS0098]